MKLRDGTTVEDPRLDRLEFFDPRSRNFPVTSVIEATKPRSYTWRCRAWLDQGREGACVGFATAHDIAARPLELPSSNALATKIYKRAQFIDEWEGEQYSGTSVLAGMKAAVELGYYGEYRWAFGEADLALAVGYKGPAILGVPWYEGMYAPDAKGFLHPTGQRVGGHAILCNGISVQGGRYRVHNSWGSDWGINGEAWISRADMRTLLGQGGEACIPVVRRRP